MAALPELELTIAVSRCLVKRNFQIVIGEGGTVTSMKSLSFLIIGIWLLPLLLCPVNVQSEDAAVAPPSVLTLEATIELAIDANLGIKSSEEDIIASKYIRRGRFTNFLPTFSTSYQYKRSKEPTISGTQIASSEDEYTITASFTQQLFTGFALINEYKIAQLGVDVSEFNEKVVKQDVILAAKQRYFEVLKAAKLVDVAFKTVTQIEQQKQVAQDFYEVGMSPLNDLLQAQVELANARQSLIVAQNNLEVAKSNLNTLLRWPVNTQISLQDIVVYSAFDRDINYCLEQAHTNRFELKIADLEIEIAERERDLSKQDYFPTVDLKGRYFKIGDDATADGFEESWDVTALASWDFWMWGRTTFGVKEKLARVSQARYRKSELWDNIQREVKEAYLRTIQSENNIKAVEKAVVQARENLRINEDRYREQVATATDLTVAQTLLTQTETNYFNALYDFKIAKATLYRVMGIVLME